MAGILAHVTSGEVSLAAGVAKTVLQVTAPTHQRLRLRAVEVCFKGTSPTDTPVYIRLLRQTTAGTMTSVTPAKNDAGDDETLQATASKDASAEPTAGDVLRTWYVHPQQGLLWVPPDDLAVVIKGGTRVGLECTAVQGNSAAASLEFEE